MAEQEVSTGSGSRAEKQGERILVVAHTGRQESLEAASAILHTLHELGAHPVVPSREKADLEAFGTKLDFVPVLESSGPNSAHNLDLVIVLGGDGTILRAAEIVRGTKTPLLGVNLGHVGFLAESERDDLGEAVMRAIAGDYAVEERMTIDVRVEVQGETVYESWALNEASIEKIARERMIELVIEVDGRPLSSFGCDGVVIATPTGSTAYSFSAGGPVVWPTTKAMLMVPLSAHALFARPVVTSPDATLAVELLARSRAQGVLWCDGRRTFDLPLGARVVVTQSDLPVRLARLRTSPFTDRLVKKFGLDVAGWRGPQDDD